MAGQRLLRNAGGVGPQVPGKTFVFITEPKGRKRSRKGGISLSTRGTSWSYTPSRFRSAEGMIKFTYKCMQLGKIENHETSKEIPLFKSIMVSDFILFEGTDQNLLVVINESCWAPINGSIHGVTGAVFPLNRWSYGPRLITGFPGPLSGSFSWSVAAGDTDAASAPECVGGSKPC